MKSLKDRILEAPSVGKVEELMAEGAGYSMAAPSTIRKWNRARDRRVQELATPPAKGKERKKS